jgi:hypothetical protein
MWSYCKFSLAVREFPAVCRWELRAKFVFQSCRFLGFFARLTRLRFPTLGTEPFQYLSSITFPRPQLRPAVDFGFVPCALGA